MIYLDVLTPAEARAEFARLFEILDRAHANQQIFDAVKRVPALWSRVRVVSPSVAV